MSNDTMSNALIAAGLGFGAAAIVAPRALGRAYGIVGNGDTDGLMRLYGSRTAALGILAATAESADARKSIIRAVAGISAVDTLGAVLSGLRGATSARTALQTAATTGAVTALCVLALKD